MTNHGPTTIVRRDVDRLHRRSGWSPRCGAGALYVGDRSRDVCGRGSAHHVPAAGARGGRNDSTLEVSGATLAGATLTLAAIVTSSHSDPTPANNAAFETTTVTSTGRNIAVTNTSDTGPGSLRQAIAESNADSGDRDTIVFNIPGSGVRTIVPLSA